MHLEAGEHQDLPWEDLDENEDHLGGGPASLAVDHTAHEDQDVDAGVRQVIEKALELDQDPSLANHATLASPVSLEGEMNAETDPAPAPKDQEADLCMASQCKLERPEENEENQENQAEVAIGIVSVASLPALAPLVDPNKPSLRILARAESPTEHKEAAADSVSYVMDLAVEMDVSMAPKVPQTHSDLDSSSGALRASDGCRLQ